MPIALFGTEDGLTCSLITDAPEPLTHSERQIYDRHRISYFNSFTFIERRNTTVNTVDSTGKVIWLLQDKILIGLLAGFTNLRQSHQVSGNWLACVLQTLMLLQELPEIAASAPSIWRS